MAETATEVDIVASNNATLQDAFQFGEEDDTSWDLTGQSFKLEIKASNDDVDPLLTLSTTDGSIVVDDIVQRVIHLNLGMVALKAALPVGEYVYDLIMYDGSPTPIRTQMMFGKFCLRQGTTED